MFKTLCQAYPEAACLDDKVLGWILLHLALLMGKSWVEVQLSFDAFPEAVWHIDKACSLPAFCLPSLVSITP
jgi:hypothetical protein